MSFQKSLHLNTINQFQLTVVLFDVIKNTYEALSKMSLTV